MRPEKLDGGHYHEPSEDAACDEDPGNSRSDDVPNSQILRNSIGTNRRSRKPFCLQKNLSTNYFLKILFRIRLNDTTNAFKAYRREVIEGCQPLIAPHFNLTVEIPLSNRVMTYRRVFASSRTRPSIHRISRSIVRGPSFRPRVQC